MELAKETGSTLKWECCPAELLCLIFRKLDTESLVKCMYVCRSWNSVSLYTAEKKSLWEKIVNKFIVDKGQMVKMKSLEMSWKDIFENSMLWSHCNKAEVSLHKTYVTGDVNHVHVYKDNLIIVSSNGVEYFDLTKSVLKRDIKMKCIDFLENDKMILKVTHSEIENLKTLYLYGKRNDDDFNILASNEKVVNQVFHYRLGKEVCYVIDYRAQLTLYKPKDLGWSEIALARYYGSYEHCSRLHIYQNKPYILLKMRHIDCPNDQSAFEGVLNVWYPESLPIMYVEMFHKFGVVYGVKESKDFLFIRNNVDGHKVFIMQCPELTCATEHGDMLFLGYSNGKIEFFMPREVNEGAALKRQYNVNQVNDSDDNCIISIDVYDERERHHLFVATRSRTYHLVLKHTNINGYLWTEYPERISLSDDCLIRSDDV